MAEPYNLNSHPLKRMKCQKKKPTTRRNYCQCHAHLRHNFGLKDKVSNVYDLNLKTSLAQTTTWCGMAYNNCKKFP